MQVGISPAAHGTSLRQHALKQSSTQVLHRNWRKILSVTGMTRNASRAVRILQWAAYHTFIAWDLLQPFHMVKCVS